MCRNNVATAAALHVVVLVGIWVSLLCTVHCALLDCSISSNNNSNNSTPAMAKATDSTITTAWPCAWVRMLERCWYDAGACCNDAGTMLEGGWRTMLERCWYDARACRNDAGTHAGMVLV